MYRQSHPQHAIYEHHQNRLGHVVPLLIHGDEGRSIKRTNFLIMSVESPLGSIVDRNLGCSCDEELKQRTNIPPFDSNDQQLNIDQDVLRRARAMVTNFKGHSFLSRFLIFGMGGWMYKTRPYIIKEMLALLTEDLTELFHQGVTLQNGETFYAAVIGVKGDMDFHHKVMELQRSYRELGTKNDTRICHLCHAGDPAYRFEDYTENPAWGSTVCTSRPWNETSPPSLSSIPYDEKAPERMLTGDLFHIVKVGVGRDLVGGILVLLLRLGFMDTPTSSKNIKDCFERAHSWFSLWCKANGKSAGLQKFTMAYFNMKTLVSAPWANSKGSDTKLLLQWLSFTLAIELYHPTVGGHTGLLKAMQQVCSACLGILGVHRHGLFMERSCARLLYGHILTFLRGYTYLGRRAIQLNIRAFIQKPKCHALHHVGMSLKQQLLTGSELILSPQFASCDINEDFIGRVSRLSRRVGIRHCDFRVCQRYGYKIVALLRRRKELKPLHSKKRAVKKRNSGPFILVFGIF